MKFELKAYGNSAVIVLPKDYLKCYGFEIGDILQVRIERVSSVSHPDNKQKTDIHTITTIPTLWVDKSKIPIQMKGGLKHGKSNTSNTKRR